MKKILPVITVLLLLISFVGCKSKSDSDVQNTTEDITLSDLVTVPSSEPTIIDSNEILTPASQGILLPNENIKLGDDVKKAYETDDPNFENTEAEKPYVSFSEVRYYYEPISSDGNTINSVYKIVQYKEGYGFSCGLTTMSEVINSLGAQEAKAESADDLYFLLSKGENTCSLTYAAGENTLKFYFTDNVLIAVLLESHE